MFCSSQFSLHLTTDDSDCSDSLSLRAQIFSLFILRGYRSIGNLCNPRQTSCQRAHISLLIDALRVHPRFNEVNLWVANLRGGVPFGRQHPFQWTNIAIFHYKAKHPVAFSPDFIYFNQKTCQFQPQITRIDTDYSSIAVAFRL